ncbi:MAG: hypothetical protein V3S89_06160 [Desulfobacterales bacterium]
MAGILIGLFGCITSALSRSDPRPQAVKERFSGRIIDIDIRVAMMWGKIQGMAERVGRPMPAVDSHIAATGITHHLTVATRNTSDMKESGAALLNPWE